MGLKRDWEGLGRSWKGLGLGGAGGGLRRLGASESQKVVKVYSMGFGGC